MEQLRDLVNIITPERLNALSILGQSKEKKLDAFYDLLVDDVVEADEAAAMKLFKKGEKHPPYLELKAELKARLVDMLFLIDVNQPINGNASLAYEEAWRLWSAANLMFLKNTVSTGVEYAEKALRLAIAFEHLDLIIQAAKLLRKIYATYLGNAQQFEHYNELYKKYETAALAEAEAEESYVSVLLSASSPEFSNKDTAALAETLFRKHESLLKTFDLFSIHRFVRYIQVTYLLHSGKFEETITASQEAIDFFEAKAFDLRFTIVGLLSYQIICYTELKDVDRGIIKLEESLRLIGAEEEISFFKVNELGFILFMHTERYQDAYHYGKTIFHHSKLKHQNIHIRTSWKIYHAFLQYFIAKGLVEIEENCALKKFRWSKFIKKDPPFDKSARNVNIPLLSIQILYAISKKKYDFAADRIAEIEKYASRYIRQSEHYRSNCFINMLAQIPQAGFHQKATERYTEKLCKKLSEMPLRVADQSFEIEIIPYERLWTMIMEILPIKRIKLKSRPKT